MACPSCGCGSFTRNASFQVFQAINLPDMLTSLGRQQAIDGVIGIISVGRHHLAMKVDGLLGILVNVGDIADRIVGVA